MLARVGRLTLPTLGPILADLGNPTACDLARLFAVHRNTASRWVREDNAPRAVRLALFWLTTWGRSELDCDREAMLSMLSNLAATQRTELENRRREIATLLRTADFGTANAPLFELVSERPRGIAPLALDPVAQRRHVADDGGGQDGAAHHDQRFA